MPHRLTLMGKTKRICKVCNITLDITKKLFPTFLKRGHPYFNQFFLLWLATLGNNFVEIYEKLWESVHRLIDKLSQKHILLLSAEVIKDCLKGATSRELPSLTWSSQHRYNCPNYDFHSCNLLSIIFRCHWRSQSSNLNQNHSYNQVQLQAEREEDPEKVIL